MKEIKLRNLSPTSLAAIQAMSGVEPSIIVRIWWAGSTYISYCDRKFETEGLLGKLISISGIDDVVDVNASTSSVNLSITLDDSDNTIKNVYDYNDIHGVYVQVLQWFTHIPQSEAFIIFEGVVASPIEWKEGDRTLKFDVVTKLADREVGFAVEEGQFDFIPSGLIGQAFPVIFGKVAGSKLLAMNESPTAVLASGFGIVNDEIWKKELDQLQDAIRQADTNSRRAYDAGIQSAIKAIEFKGGAFFPDDPSQADQYDQAAQSYYEQSSQYAEERIRLQLEFAQKKSDYDFQKSVEFRVLPISQTNLPSGSYTVEMNNYTASVTVVGNAMIIHSLTEKIDPNKPLQQNNYSFLLVQGPRAVNDYTQTNEGQKFVWIDGGTQIKIYGFPRYFIASIGFVNIINLWGKNKYGKAVVPRNWYVVDYTMFGSLPVTRIIFPSPIENYPGEWQDGDYEIDCQGSLGPNAVDIMIWAIQTFSGFTYDNDTFVYVRNKVAAMPMNFVLDKRINVVNFLKEVAFQARCAIWLNDRRFYLRFLPEELSPVETLTDADIEVNSLSITSDPTESLVTKFTATWKARWNQSEPSKIIFRYNIQKYGTNEEEYDFYCYNQEAFVQKAAEFWMIRKSNSWKHVQMKVFLNKLRIESFDPVELNLSEDLASIGPVTGLVTKSTFDADDDSLTVELWLPVRLGEMYKYVYAYPGSTQEIYPKNDDINIVTGNPWQDARGEIVPIQFIPTRYQVTIKHAQRWFTSGTGLPGNVDPFGQDFITFLDPSEINANRPPGLAGFNNRSRHDVNDIDEFAFASSTPNIFYGNALERLNNNLYSCSVYTRGFGNDPTTQQVKIAFIREETTLPAGYPLTVYRTIWIERDGTNTLTRFEYWALPPLWAPPSVQDNP